MKSKWNWVMTKIKSGMQTKVRGRKRSSSTLEQTRQMMIFQQDLKKEIINIIFAGRLVT
jgi:hypothetical protein